MTRSRPKIDRIACPWLIRRFVDPAAVFLFVSPAEVHAVAERFNGAPFDIEGVFWSHRGDRCTFDTLLDELGLQIEPLAKLAAMVRGADTARLDLAPEAPGLAAASLGLSRMYSDDLEQLAATMTLYDALYRWARDASDETHDWPTNKPKKLRSGRFNGERLSIRIRRKPSDVENCYCSSCLARSGGCGVLSVCSPRLVERPPAPPAIEMEVATWLLLHSVPAEASARANPLKPDEANIAAGASSFQQKCSVCHGFRRRRPHHHRGTCLSTGAIPSPSAPFAHRRPDFHLHQ